MDGKQLKNSILQWAIQGKLVPQNPKDEPASKLLERIAESRNESSLSLPKGTAKGTKSKDPGRKKSAQSSHIYRENGVWYEQVGTATPKDISDEIPFEIPESWVWCRLEKIVSINGGFAFKSGNYVEQGKGVRVLRISDFNENGFVNTKKVYHPYDESLADYRLSENDIVMCMTGGTVGKTMYVTVLPEPMLVNQRVADISIIGDIESKYVYQVMSSNVVQDIVLNSKNSTNDNISMELIKNFLIPLPPLDEQKRIVAKLEQVLPLAEEYGAAQEQLDKLNKELPEALKKSILQEAIQGKLVPQSPKDEPASVLLAKIQKEKEALVKQGKLKKKDLEITPIDDDEIPFEIPDSWTWCRMDQLTAILNGDRGKNYPAKSTLNRKGIPFISALNLDGKSVIEDERLLCLSEEQYNKLGNGKLVKGDIVVCIRGSLGKHGRYPYDRGAIASSLVILRPYYLEDIFADFIMLYLDSPAFYNEIKRFDNGTAQPNLAAESLKQFYIPLPPLAEQKRIVAKLEQLFKVL